MHKITASTLHSFCRTCLNELEQPHMYSIERMDVQIRHWLQDLTVQGPVTDDAHPTYVCRLCREKLEYILEFQQMCLRSRKLFQDILAKTCNRQMQANDGSTWDTMAHADNEQQINYDWLDFQFDAVPKSMVECEMYKRQAIQNDEPITTQSSRKQIASKRKDSVDSYSSSDENDECSRSPEDIAKSNDKQEEDANPPRILRDLRKSPIKKLSIKRKRNSNSEHPHTQHVCEECGKVFEKLKQLEKHQYSHKPPEEHPFYCSDCNKLYKSQQTFKEHQLRHSGIKNFECPYCGVKKTTKNELQTHLNYHTKERQYLCPNCPMIFSRISNFRRHDEVVHQGIRRYICRYCDQAFGKPNTLKHHEMIHTGEKPHECPECGKRFRQQVQLTTHMRVHTKQLNQQKINPNLVQKGFDVI